MIIHIMGKKIYFTVDEIGNTSCEKDCRETAINWQPSDKNIIVSTSDPKVITKLKRMMKKFPDAYKCYSYEGNIDTKSGQYYTYFFEFDKKLLSFRGPTERKPMSEEQRKAAAERFKKMWAERGLDVEDLTEDDIDQMIDEDDME